jgi:voltage-gated potassium channel
VRNPVRLFRDECGESMTESLATQLAIATAMVALTVVIHLLGLSVLIAATNRHSNRLQAERALAGQMLVLLGVSFGLFVLHGIEIWSYSTLYFLVGATRSFADALYFSTATYATIGDRDLISKSWRVLGAIEGANGIILLGWSTAFFVSIVARIRVLEHDWSGSIGGSPQPSSPGHEVAFGDAPHKTHTLETPAAVTP